MNEHHEQYMMQCLTLAESGRVRVGNGALVGALLVLWNNIFAQGIHAAFGESHAERDLLEHSKEPVPPEAVLYVNLEPCCHHGKTPPCTDIILERGVKRVCFGMLDPDPRVTGKGIDILRNAGVEVIGPVARASCEYVNRGFVSVRTKGRPWITLKRAQARDGRIAREDKSPLKITSKEQDAWSHTFLRYRHDAILVGVETIVQDDPSLDTRFAQFSTLDAGLYKNYRIVFDPALRCPVNAKVLTDTDARRTILVTAAQDDKKTGDLTRHGARILRIPLKDGAFDWGILWKSLTEPQGDFHGLTSILVEGGQKTWDAFTKDGMMDEEVTLVGR